MDGFYEEVFDYYMYIRDLDKDINQLKRCNDTYREKLQYIQQVVAMSNDCVSNNNNLKPQIDPELSAHHDEL